MSTARTNVTDIRRFSRTRDQSGGPGGSPLDDCREIAALGVTDALGEALPLAAGKLLDMAEKAVGLDIYHLHMDAMELARDRRADIQSAFRAHFLQRFNRSSRREARGGQTGDEDDQRLSLLEPDDLEEHLAAETLANAIHNACSEELFGLDKRLGMLVNDPELRHGDNPLGPEVIGAALLDALEDMDVGIKIRLLLVSLLNRHLPERVKAVYQDLNRQLIKRGILPTIRVGLRRNRQGKTAAPGEGTNAAAGSGDLFATLQQLMAVGRGYGGGTIQPIPAPPMPGDPAPGLAAGGLPPGGLGAAGIAAFLPFMQALNRLQRGEPAELAGTTVDPASLANGQANLLHGLRNSGLAGVMAPLDVMTLDIVAMVFDYILDDARIPDAIKALIGRLQIPVLKVAMLDKSFFSQKSHPARQLLDALAEAAIGWDAAEGHESGLFRKVDELVQHILNQFDDRVEIFSEALEDLRQYLDGEKRDAERQASQSVQVIRAREQESLARIVAHDEVHSRLLGHAVPDGIRVFLTDYWEALLVALHRKAGIDSQAWTGALETVDDLIWSAEPKLSPEDRKRLVDILPSLLKRLDEGMQFMAFPGEERDRFFAGLVKYHAEAVKAGLHHLPDMPPVDEDFLRFAAVGGEVPRIDPPTDFEPVQPPREPLADESDMDTVMVRADGGDADPPADLHGLSGLKRGSWIEYRQEDGEWLRAKLSWVSPMKGIYLFTNRLGQRAISIGAEGLSAKLDSGEVKIIDDMPLVDRAVNRLMDRLQRQAG